MARVSGNPPAPSSSDQRRTESALRSLAVATRMQLPGRRAPAMVRTIRSRRFEPTNASLRLRRLSKPHRDREERDLLPRKQPRRSRQPRYNGRPRFRLLRRNPRARRKLLGRNARLRLRLLRPNPSVLPLRGDSLPTARLLECKPRPWPRSMKRKPRRPLQPWRRNPRRLRTARRKLYPRLHLLSHSTRQRSLTLSRTPLRPWRRRRRNAVPPSPCRLRPTTRASRLFRRATRPPCPRA